jgi:hypothetical protein
MNKVFHCRTSDEYARRKCATLSIALLASVNLLAGVSLHPTLAQSKSTPPPPSSLCNRDDALQMVQQQVEFTRTFDSTVRRITVLIRAADLLWPFQQDKARTVFTEAMELAERDEQEERERSEKAPRNLIFEMQVPDQRYVVIRAVAKRDRTWARKLTEQLLKLDRQRSTAAARERSDALTAIRLLDAASQLLSTDFNAALDLARNSLNYPATGELARFLYKVSEVNQQAADQFYDQALVAYADRPMREFLYLQAYPFGFREGGDMPFFASYVVPDNFAINRLVQLRFVEALLRRAQQSLETPLDEGDNFNGLPGNAHILQVVMRIEPEVKERLPNLLPAVVQAREKMLVSLSVETQKVFQVPGRNEVSELPRQTFAEQIETAEKTPDVNTRDDLIASAVLGATGSERLIDAVNAAEIILDSSIRTALLEWLYFQRAKEAVGGKQFDEAERLLRKVEGREQRSFLQVEIARGLLRKMETQTRAREILEEGITEANKGGRTIFAARTLLTASSLFARIDVSRSIAVLGDAVDRVNHLEAPDFSAADQTLIKHVQRKSNPGRFVFRFYMPGPDPERAFSEMGKIDFDGALSQANALTDKFHRAMTTLALADICLQRTPLKLPADRRKKNSPKRTPAASNQ